ncbi:hypothetical protein HY78_08255 [Rhizorhabdus wittichii DC-6]|nr:hypothetical protein HY78_08255 [Rhizorhabdus wittichii DC-6]
MTIICALPGNEALARRLAAILHAPVGQVEARQFPDGESYVRFACNLARSHVVLVCTLARPDSQVLRLLIAADAARDLGARTVTLVAPYLAYMRQDKRFHPGEAISSRTFARLLSSSFDRIITVSPHLHRYRVLSELYTIEAVALDAAPMLVAWLRAHVDRPLLIGPDSESQQWVGSVAGLAGAPFVVGRKARSGDRQVSVELPVLDGYRHHNPIIIDDIISSGATLKMTAGKLREQGFSSVGCLAIHALLSDADRAALLDKVDLLVTSDSIENPHARIALAPLLASALAHAPATGGAVNHRRAWAGPTHG